MSGPMIAPELAKQVVRAEAGQQAAVQLDLDLRRDHVHGGAAPDDRRVHRVPEHALERAALLAHQPKRGAVCARVKQGPEHCGLRRGQGRSAPGPADTLRTTGELCRRAAAAAQPALDRRRASSEPPT